MRKVTTISLNNNAFQVEEEGYEALRGYLAAAEANLAGNPDRAEILTDLEQAIGEKCRASLGPHKSVVTADEIARILQEMGPVVAPGETAGNAGAGAHAHGAQGAAAQAPGASARRRLYRIEEGRMWAGVCTGLAAYFGFDPVWVRVAFILLTVFTSGIWLLVYLAMCFIVPMAETAEERAAAYGAPFNAQELIDRVKKKPADLRAGRARRRAERRSQHYMGRSYWEAREHEYAPRPGYFAQITGGLMVPVVTVLSAAWFVAMALALLVVWTGVGPAAAGGWSVQGWNPNLPGWVALLVVILVYALVAMPLAAIRRACLYYANGGRRYGWADAWSALLWIALVGAALFIAWQYAPWVQQSLLGLPWTAPSSGWI